MSSTFSRLLNFRGSKTTGGGGGAAASLPWL